LYATMANVYAKVGGLDKSIEYFEKAVNWIISSIQHA